MVGLKNNCLTCPDVIVKVDDILGLVHLGESTVTLTLALLEVVTKSSTLMVVPLFSI
jgi:hypothetical protein